MPMKYTFTNKLTLNAVSSIIQVFFTALLYFFLYRYLLSCIGIELFGVWSLILSFSSIANLANLGITSGLVKFVAEYITEDDKHELGKLIFTSMFSTTFLFLIFSTLVFLLSRYFLHYAVDNSYLQISLEIIPFSLLSLSINAVSGVFTSVLEGFQKNYYRNLIYLLSGIIMFVTTVILAPLYGVKGVALAQLVQSFSILVLAVILNFYISDYTKPRYWRWSKNTFLELFNYGYKFQLVSVAQLFYEPTTKILLSKFGGLSLLGHYEMATRLVSQFRSLMVNANQVVVPVIATNNKVFDQEKKNIFFSKMNRFVATVTFPLSGLLIVITPLISLIWIGDVNKDFVFSMVALTIATAINIISGPTYFSCLADGRLNILVIVHVLMAILNLLLGYLLIFLFHHYGTVLGWVASLTIGSMILILIYFQKSNIKFKTVFTKDNIFSLISIMILGITTLVLVNSMVLNNNIYIKLLILVLLYMVLFIPSLIKNKTLVRLINIKIEKK